MTTDDDDDSQALIDLAIGRMLEAEHSRGVRASLFGEERNAVLALRASSLEEYVCATNLALAERKRRLAANYIARSEERKPSGRRVHTIAASQVIQADAAECLEAASVAESAAIAAINAPDLEATLMAVAHMEVSTEGSPPREWDLALAIATQVRSMRERRRRWLFVRGRAELAPQPRGGLLPLAQFERFELGGSTLTRSSESGNAGTIASAVELIARWDLAGDPRAGAEAVTVPLEAIRAVRRGEHTESGLGLMAALLRPRAGIDDELDELEWETGDGDETLAHISEMRARVSGWFERFGRPLQPGSWVVRSELFKMDGHIDFVTVDTIWDLKVSGTAPGRVDILQLLLYWIMFRADPKNSISITHVGIYNPRLDVAWRIAVADLAPDLVFELEAIASASSSP